MDMKAVKKNLRTREAKGNSCLGKILVQKRSAVMGCKGKGDGKKQGTGTAEEERGKMELSWPSGKSSKLSDSQKVAEGKEEKKNALRNTAGVRRRGEK